LQPLVRLAAAVVVTRSSSPRAAEPTDVAHVAARMTRAAVTAAPDIPAAIAAARSAAGPDGLVCVAGSLALAADARTALGLAPSEHWW